MTVKEIQRIASALGSFASTRDTAKGPESLIGVQVGPSGLKLIAGSDNAGVIVSVGGTEGKFSYTIEAKTLLQSVKILPAKSEIELKAHEGQLEITTNSGGSVTMRAKGVLREAGFPKKPKEFESKVFVPEGGFERIAKMLNGISRESLSTPKLAKYEPITIEIIDGLAHLVVVAPGIHPKYALAEFKAEGESGSHYGAEFEFFDALSSLDGEGVIQLGNDGFLATSGNIEVFTLPRMVAGWDEANQKPLETIHNPAWPIMRARSPKPAWQDRRAVLASVKNSSEPRFRVGGHGFNPTYFVDILSSLDSKSVAFGWVPTYKGCLIMAEGWDNWTVLVAPMKEPV